MATDFERILKERVLLLDGATGVILQKYGCSNLDMLSLTHPGLVAGVHDAYLAAGADIIETNTFTANALSQQLHGTAGRVREINIAAARIARESADACMAADPSRPRFAGGSIGPASDPSPPAAGKHPADSAAGRVREINIAAARIARERADACMAADPSRPRFAGGSIGPAFDHSSPASGKHPADSAADSETRQKIYADQATALIEGGVDLLMIETVIDASDARCALAGAREAMRRSGKKVPLTVSATISDVSGKLLSGHSPEEFIEAVAPYAPVAIGFNCSTGPESLAVPARQLARLSPFPMILYPNAGLPDSEGNYALGPDEFAAALAPLLSEGIPRIIGGCCGTGPAHTAALARCLRNNLFK